MCVRRKRARLAVWVVVCFALCLPLTAQEQRIKLAIVAFDDPVTYGDNPLRAGRLGRETADKLAQELSKTKEFIITERAVADRLFFSATQAAFDVDSETLVKQGKALRVDYFLLGRVEISYNEAAREETVWVGLNLTRRMVYDKNITAQISFRIVRASSAEVFAADEGGGRSKGTYLGPGFVDSLLAAAISAAVSDTLAKLRGYAEVMVKPPWEIGQEEELSGQIERLNALSGVEGRILGQAPDGSYVVSVGSDHGLAEGDILKVMGEEVIRDKKTGQVIFSETREKGKLKITRLQTERAVAAAAGGEGFAAGDSVRPDVRALEDQVSRTFKREPTVEELVDRGRRLYRARLYGPAITYLEQARAKLTDDDPRGAEVAGLVGSARFKLGDSEAAAASWTWMVQHGEPLEMPAYHSHFSGTCLGTLQLTKNGFRFQSPQADHSFDTPIEGLAISFIESHVQVSAPPLGKTKAKRWDLYLVAANDQDRANLARVLSKMLATLQRK